MCSSSCRRSCRGFRNKGNPLFLIWMEPMCCSPTKMTELSESVLVEHILVEFKKKVFLAKIIKEREWRSGLQ